MSAPVSYKVILIGDSGVGKSSLLLRYASDTYVSDFITTIGVEFRLKTLTINGIKVKLCIYDTAGQERFRSITTAYYRKADGIIIVYDVSDVQSFENIEEWIEDIDSYAPPHHVKLIIGNKTDIEYHAVSTERGKALADKHQALFTEASPKTAVNVNTAFLMMVNELLKRNIESNIIEEPIESTKSGCCYT